MLDQFGRPHSALRTRLPHPVRVSPGGPNVAPQDGERKVGLLRRNGGTGFTEPHARSTAYGIVLGNREILFLAMPRSGSQTRKFVSAGKWRPLRRCGEFFLVQTDARGDQDQPVTRRIGPV
jgi:hypothetical protein